MVRVSSLSTVAVGAIRLTGARPIVLPKPVSTWPRGPGGRMMPNWYCARRLIALPASTISPATASVKPAGAKTWTLPAATSASLVTPLAPPKWSVWLWV